MGNKNLNNYTVGFAEANAGALITSVPICAIIVFFYVGFYSWDALLLHSLSIADILILAALMILGIITHEGIHALSWSWFDDIPQHNIHFGFKWSTLTPYVHCDVPIIARNYRWGTAMPGIILGIIPAVAALVWQNVWMLYFGLIFTMAAGGDFLILWLLRRVDSDALVQDHSELIGCQVVNDLESRGEG